MVGITSLSAGCFPHELPDQGQFVPLSSFGADGVAVVRVYCAPLPGLEGVAVHPWFVVKSVDATTFDRWEVWPVAEGPYGHVRKNMLPPEADLGAGGVGVLSELVGEEAETVVAFVESESPRYPCRDSYVLFPGPNSSSYAQWVLDNTGWEVTLPPGAIGQDVAAVCP